MRYGRHIRHRRHNKYERHGTKVHDFLNPPPVITAGTAPANAKVNGTVDLTTLFSVKPTGTPLTFAVSNANATLGGDGKTLTYKTAGKVVVTAKATGATDATLEITIAAA